MNPGDEHYRYFVSYRDRVEREVSGDVWRRAERAAGFSAPEGQNATAGFTGLNGLRGRREIRK